MVKLNEIANNPSATKNRKRVGRGIGSGKGKTSGHGVKGQKSRSGVAINGFEGGQMPIHRRLPKRGFNNPTRKELEAVNIAALQRLVDAKKIKANSTLSLENLVELGLVSGKKDGVKLLASGELKQAVSVEVNAASETAIKAIEKAGGKVTIAELKSAKPKTSKASSSSGSEAKNSRKKAA